MKLAESFVVLLVPFQRNAMRPHGNAPAKSDIPVNQAGAHVAVSLMKILRRLEDDDAALDQHRADCEVEVGDVVDKLGADDDGLVV